jgi:processive 1,2-diacylglycerol beta-glucosyltransferase
LIAANPDIIVATHFLPIGIAGFLKKRHKINSRLICIITDFDVHPLWVIEKIDQYIVGCPITAAQLNGFGISNDKIKIMGIPVDGKFSENIEKEGIYKKLNLEKNKFTVLILTAAFGFGPIEEIVNLLYRQVQILVVCGRNTGLYRRLAAKKYNSVRIFGLVDNIEELMAAAHLVITKPGGLTIAESLAMERPMIFFRAIYGQETKNAEILENYGVGINTKNLIDIREAVLNYKNSPQRLDAVKEKIRKIKKPNATREICAWLTSM